MVQHQRFVCKVDETPEETQLNLYGEHAIFESTKRLLGKIRISTIEINKLITSN